MPSLDAGPPVRISAVSFFNTAALIYGLADVPGVVLRRGVPSSLLDDLRENRADVALLPVIDYQRMDGLSVIPAGGIGCDGPTLTVRLFSPRPIDQTRVLAVDGDSHTSVVLARVIFDKVYGRRPDVIPLADAGPEATRLLIGDKVITAAPDLPFQLDLGEAWKRLTGLPFVFAIWTARPDFERQDFERPALAGVLADCLRRGLADVDALVAREAVPRGWPADVARRYLTEYLKFTIGPKQLEAIGLFHQFAWEVGALDRPPRAL
ncbi:MAG TPA: menaquinone biosynthesis protein [Tepidisphaeraceae bacterium]|jgi:chorismate dehydratase